MATIRIRRGLEASRTSITPQQGEPLYTTDTKKFYVGDGSTAGGVIIGEAANQAILNNITSAGSGDIITAAERSKLSAIEANAKDDQVASEVPVTPSGNLAATDTQAALVELQSDVDTRIATSEKGANSGVATLDATGKVPNAQIPPLAISETYVVADIPARDALTGIEEGDVAIVTSTSQSFIWDGTAWQEILTPATGVTSFNGRLGAVTPAAADYTATQVTNTPSGNLAGATVQLALDELQGDIDTLSADSHTHTNKTILDEIPNLTLTGNGEKYLRVNAGGTALEWVDLVVDGGTFV